MLELVEDIEEDVDDIEDALELDDDSNEGDEDDDEDDGDDNDEDSGDESELEELDEVIDELEDALEEIAEDVDELEDALESEEDSEEDDDEEEDENDDKDDDDESESEDLVDDLEDLLEVIEEIEEDVDDIEDALDLDDDDDFDELEEAIDELEDALEEVADDLDDLEESLDPDSDDNDDQDEDEDDNDNDEDDEDDESDVEDLIDDIEDLLELVEEIEEDVDDIEDALDLDDDSNDDDDDREDDGEDDDDNGDESELEELEEVIDELEDALEELAEDVDDIEDALESETDNDDDEEEDEEGDDDDAEDDIEDLIEDIEDLLEVIEEIEEDVDNIEDALDLDDSGDDLDNGDVIGDSDESSDYAAESNQVHVTFNTKEILGVQSVVVRDVAWEEGVLVEDTFDWYAQDTDGNVWYMGEIATNYEYDDEGNFIGTNTDGSWEAGIDGALPGYIMEANPKVGDRYFQEFAAGVAEDEGEVIGLNETVTIGFGTFENVLKIRDFTALEPDVFEFKYYAPGVGQILADEGITEVGGEPELSPELVGTSTLADATLPALGSTQFEDSATIDNAYFPLNPGNVYIYEGEELDSDTGEMARERNEVFVTNETKDILGVTTRVVRDRSYQNNLLVEEEVVYYAQDTDGNVWIMGEESTEYEYDDNGNVINTDESDSWIAGMDQNLPGFVALGTPEVGDVYYQRFQIGEEEEQAQIVDVEEAISTELGRFTNALVIKEFSALEPGESDLTYSVPGLGQVLEQEFEEGVQVGISELVGVFQRVEGTTEGDRLIGTRANDMIDGGKGNDWLSGKKGDDWLVGGEGRDRLHGGNGDDRLDGGPGRDSYTGGKGADIFVIRPGAGEDIIRDFKPWQGDKIALTGGVGFSDLTINRFGRNGASLSINGEELATVHAPRFNAVNESAFVTL